MAWLKLVSFALITAILSTDATFSAYVPPEQRPAYFKRVVAIGDLHGDYDNTLTSLRLGKLIDPSNNWAAEETVFVQVGDIFDRGNDTIQIFKLLDKLRVQARLAGGNLISHFGNHEMMNMIGDWRYVLEGEIDTFGGVEERFETITHGWIGDTLRTNYNITTRLPLHPAAGELNADFDPTQVAASNLSHAALSFVHGGLASDNPDLTPYPSRLNNLGASFLGKLQARLDLPTPFPPAEQKPPLPEGVTDEETLFNGVEGPYWARDWLTDESEDVCDRANRVLESIGCSRMLMGHTPVDTTMYTRCDAKIVDIDTGISRGVLDSPSALEIIYTLTPTEIAREWIEEQSATAFYPTTSTLIWTERREVFGDFEQWH